MSTALSLSDRARYDELKLVVKKGLGTFVEVGNALVEIHDGKLYQVDYDTFEACLAAEWDMSWSRGRQLMQGAKVADSTLSAGGIAPANERQAGALAPLKAEPARMAKVMAEVAAEGPVTAKAITAAVKAERSLVGELLEKAAKGKKKPKKVKPAPDEIGPDSKNKRWGRGVTANDFYTRPIRALIRAGARLEEDVEADALKLATHPGELAALGKELRQTVAAINRVIDILDAL